MQACKHACMHADACGCMLEPAYVYVYIYMCIDIHMTYIYIYIANMNLHDLFVALCSHWGKKGVTRRLFLFPRMNRTERVRTAQRAYTNIYEACTPIYDLPRETQIMNDKKTCPLEVW